jgi:NTE family protein
MAASDGQSDGNPLRADLVFEGGGVKGIALAGAFRALTDRGYQAQCVAGTSAGAITAALVAAGYGGSELEQIVLEKMHFPDFEDRGFGDRLGRVGQIAEFVRRRGIHSGDYFLHWMRDRLKEKGVTTFGDLRDPNASDPKRRYRLRLIASDLSERRMLVLPDDAARLGRQPDQLEVAEAVRMSMSIPVFFRPVTANGHQIVDGGLLSNYPIWLFDAPADRVPEFPTFGMLLVAPNQTAPLMPTGRPGTSAAPLKGNLGFLKAIAETMMEAHDRFYVETANYARTIPLPTLGVKTTEFDLSEQRAAELFESGKQAAEAFLATWSFDEYKARFRSGPAPTRRDSVLATGSATAPSGSAVSSGNG